MDEIWKDIEGYEGLYQISNFGRIRNWKKWRKYWRLVKPLKNKNGYQRICLSKNNIHKYYSIHRLVGIHFIPIPQYLLDQGYTYDTLQINHKDEDKTNNCVWNLEWCTAKYNANYGTRIERWLASQCIPVTQFDLSGNFIKNWPSATDAARALNIHQTAISFCCNKKPGYNSSKKFIWRFTKPEYKEGYKLDSNDIHSRFKKVSCFDLQGQWLKTYDHIGDCAQQLNLDSTCISNCCVGRASHVGPYILKYFNPYHVKGFNLFEINMEKVLIQPIKQISPDNNQTLATYSNCIEAFKQVCQHIKTVNGWQLIYKCCNDIIPLAYGYKWKFLY